jgi:hypothetical protein
MVLASCRASSPDLLDSKGAHLRRAAPAPFRIAIVQPVLDGYTPSDEGGYVFEIETADELRDALMKAAGFIRLATEVVTVPELPGFREMEEGDIDLYVTPRLQHARIEHARSNWGAPTYTMDILAEFEVVDSRASEDPIYVPIQTTETSYSFYRRTIGFSVSIILPTVWNMSSEALTHAGVQQMAAILKKYLIEDMQDAMHRSRQVEVLVVKPTRSVVRRAIDFEYEITTQEEIASVWLEIDGRTVTAEECELLTEVPAAADQRAGGGYAMTFKAVGVTLTRGLNVVRLNVRLANDSATTRSLVLTAR